MSKRTQPSPALPVWATWLLAVTPCRHRGDDVGADLAELFHDRRARYGRLYAHRRLCLDLVSLWRGAFRGGTLAQDLRYALRLCTKQPGPVTIAAAGLALAIGVVTTAYSLINATMLRPYGMDDPSSVVSVHDTSHGERPFPYWPYRHFVAMRAGSTLDTVEASLLERARFSAVPAEDGGPQRWLQFVSGGYLHTFGGRPLLGRPLQPADDAPGAPLAVVVSHQLWSSDLGADPTTVGGTVWLNGVAATLVGVLEPGFSGPSSTRPSVWMPLSALGDVRGGAALTSRSGELVKLVARLAPGASREALEDNLTAVAADAMSREANPSARPRTARLYSAARPIDGPDAGESYLVIASLLAVVGLVLVLACANTANLLLASATARSREIGVRLALGATTRRLVRQLLSESLLLAVVAGLLGWLLALVLAPLVAVVIEVSPEINLAPDARILVFAIVVSALCGIGAGLSPARYGARGNVLAALRSGGSLRDGRRPSWLRTGFVGLQAAVSMLLLMGAILLTRTAVRVADADVGFDADRVLSVNLSGNRDRAGDPAFLVRVVDELGAMPGVGAVSVTQYEPFGMSVELISFAPDRHDTDLSVHRVDERYLATAGVRLVRGRQFSHDDIVQEAPVALVSERVVRTLFDGTDPIGRPLSSIPGMREEELWGVDATIVGVVGDAMMSRRDLGSFGTIYRPLQRERSNPPSLIVRTAAPGLVAQRVEQAVRRLDPSVRATATVVNERLSAYLASKQQLAWMAGPLAVLAFLLAGLGIFGVTAFAVSQRSHEVTVRLAVGASAGDVLRLLVAQSLRPVAIGLIVGLAVALGLSRFFASLLSGISPHDPISIAIATTVLLTGAFLAVVVPARRVASADPAGILRQG